MSYLYERIIINNYNNGVIGFLEGLQLLFIALKLTDVITWSWWLVLIPTIIPFSLVMIFFLIVWLWAKN